MLDKFSEEENYIANGNNNYRITEQEKMHSLISYIILNLLFKGCLDMLTIK